MRIALESTVRFVAIGFIIISAVVTLTGLGDINVGLNSANVSLADAGWNLFYWGILLSFVSLALILYLTLKRNRLTILGLILGASILTVALFPPIFLAKPFVSPKDFAIDAKVLPSGPALPDNSTCPLFNETYFDFEVNLNKVFAFLNFSRILSSSHIVWALPFKILNASAWPGGPTQLSSTFQAVYPKATEVEIFSQHAWLQNVSFTSSNGSPTKLLNGTVATEFTLGNDIREVGPWTNTIFLSFGSNTSPLRYISSKGCASVFPTSPTVVEITFPQNQIVGPGTFPTPDFIATNVYVRGVQWSFPSSNHFNDIQLFLESSSAAVNSEVPWTAMVPFPSSWQPFVLSVGFVLLQVSLTRFFSQSYSRKSPRIPKDGLKYIE